MAFLDKAGGGGYRIHRHDTNTLLITTTIQQTVMNIEVSIMSINLSKLVLQGVLSSCTFSARFTFRSVENGGHSTELLWFR